MSFLDNLENNLKALESRTERDPAALAREAEAREAARSAALEIAPYAEALRNGPFKDALLTACREIGHRRRMLVRPVWVDSTLRLETGAKSWNCGRHRRAYWQFPSWKDGNWQARSSTCPAIPSSWPKSGWKREATRPRPIFPLPRFLTISRLRSAC